MSDATLDMSPLQRRGLEFVQCPYREDRETWERLVEDTGLVRARSGGQGWALVEAWVNLAVEATYFGEGSELRGGIHHIGRLASRGRALLELLRDQPELREAVASARALAEHRGVVAGAALLDAELERARLEAARRAEAAGMARFLNVELARVGGPRREP